MSKIDDEFHKYTYKHKEGDRFCINCKKGFWGVSAPTKEEATREAKHYFVQYWMDGEYSDDPNTFKAMIMRGNFERT